MRWRGKEKELSGAVPLTTNNRMELTAAIEALSALKRPCTVRVCSDSIYLRDGITRWIHAWQRNGWRAADRRPVRNRDLWEQLIEIMAPIVSIGFGFAVITAIQRTSVSTRWRVAPLAANRPTSPRRTRSQPLFSHRAAREWTER